MSLSTTFHDLLDPLSGERVSLRIENGTVTGQAETLPGDPHHEDIDGSELWILPALYDADAHLPLLAGRRPSDVYSALHGGVARMNVALQWQNIRDLDLASLVTELRSPVLPRITPILSVHSDLDSKGFPEWLEENAETIRTEMPPVCKLYSYGDGFWENLDTVLEAGLLPVIYCKEATDIESVVSKGKPVHFRHAMSEETVELMSRLDGATLQTSPHFLLPVAPEIREQLYVLPPVQDGPVREGLVELFLDRIDLLVTDHNAPPVGPRTGPGLSVQQDFAAAVLTLAELYGWPLERLWPKVTTSPAARYGVDLDNTFAVIDPSHRRTPQLWPHGQTPERAPFTGLELKGKVMAVGADGVATLV